MANDNNNRSNNNGSGSGLGRAAKILAVAAGAAGAAAAGYYFYASKNAARNRKVASRWATDFKDDVMNQARELEHIDRATLIGIIDGVARAYGKMRGMNVADLRDAADELKEHWQRLSAELNRGNGGSRSNSSPTRPLKRASVSKSSSSRSRSRKQSPASERVSKESGGNE